MESYTKIHPSPEVSPPMLWGVSPAYFSLSIGMVPKQQNTNHNHNSQNFILYPVLARNLCNIAQICDFLLKLFSMGYPMLTQITNQESQKIGRQFCDFVGCGF